MRKFGIWLVAVGICLGFVSGCGQQETITPSGGTGYWPHNDGYSWTYKYHYTGSPEATFTRTFSGTTICTLDSTAYVFQREILTYSTTGEIWYRFTDEKVELYGPAYPVKYTWLVYPLEVGKSWTAWTGGVTMEVTVEAFESVTVPAGTYNAFRVWRNQNITGVNYHTWYAENVGIVKFELSDIDMTSYVTAELVSKNF